ncbi:hypothetical protein FRB99_007807 [Tulasnella sp. 403]|nr:hypothetical protein FRB99_007807 [Tulasnella sp. 403]
MPKKELDEPSSNLSPDMQQRLEKLKRLLDTSTAYSTIIADRIKSQKQKRAALAKRVEGGEVNANGKRQSDASLTTSPSKRVKNENGEGLAQDNKATTQEEILYMRQPASVSGATLRDYQLAGVQWLALLYENGLNGILADEMGLGKTLQTIAFLAHLKERDVWGPFLVVCPLSVLHNWASEFQKFAPTIPVCIYHGTPVERKEIIRTSMALPTDLNTPANSRAGTPSGGRGRKPKGGNTAARSPSLRTNTQTKATFPVVLTTYEMVIKDSKILSKYSWSFVIIDEGHRLRNMETRFVMHSVGLVALADTTTQLGAGNQDLPVCQSSYLNGYSPSRKCFTSSILALSTDTYQQNNLNELWSLLNFIMPKIFDDLSAFQAWFTPAASSQIGSADKDESGLSAEQSAQIITSLHSILKPFLLRRLKVDVEVNLPPKKEYILYAPLTPQQVEVYDCVVAGGSRLREWLVKKLCGADGELDEGMKRALQDRKGTVESALAEIQDETIAEAISKRRKRGDKKAISYIEVEDDDEWLDDFVDQQTKRSRISEKSAHDTAREYYIKEAFRIVNNMHLQNKMMQLRKVCSHPFLFHWPNDPKTRRPVVSDQLINASGKMLLLNRLLVELFKRGHKVLIFSQFTTMLDIIEDWATEFKKWKICRIDGTTKNDERRDQMNAFNQGGDGPDACRLFLLSTRAGGLGINLVAADSVIFYDSDWNPQMDLQAQDRAHRIGQTRPVLIFRLVSAHTVETHMLESASKKRKLEALVIARGKFKAVGGLTRTATSKAEAESAAAALLSLEGEKIDVVNSADDKIISDADLDILLDRRPEVFTNRGVGWSKPKGAGAGGQDTAMDTEAGGDTKSSVAFKVFERTTDELNDGLATMLDDDEEAPPAPTQDLPFPEGQAQTNKPLEVVLQDLNRGVFPSRRMSHVDDFLVRALFETKHFKKKPVASETAKFFPSTTIPNAIALRIAQDWARGRLSPISEWTSIVSQIWETHVVPEVPHTPGWLLAEDKEFFVKSFVRYGLIYHQDSPVELFTVRFPGVEQNHRGVRARLDIPSGTFILQMGGWVSKDPWGNDLTRLSVVQTFSKKRKGQYNALLTGPVRFLNHRCQPNCEFRFLIDPETTKELHALMIVASRNIQKGEELTIDYGGEYFQGEQRCLCHDCIPRVDEPVERIPPAPKKRKTKKRYNRKLRSD